MIELAVDVDVDVDGGVVVAVVEFVPAIAPPPFFTTSERGLLKRLNML